MFYRLTGPQLSPTGCSHPETVTRWQHPHHTDRYWLISGYRSRTTAVGLDNRRKISSECDVDGLFRGQFKWQNNCDYTKTIKWYACRQTASTRKLVFKMGWFETILSSIHTCCYNTESCQLKRQLQNSLWNCVCFKYRSVLHCIWEQNLFVHEQRSTSA